MRNLVFINNDTHQRETLSERPIRPPLSKVLTKCYIWKITFKPDILLEWFDSCASGPHIQLSDPEGDLTTSSNY